MAKSLSSQARLCAKNSNSSTSPVHTGDFNDVPSVFPLINGRFPYVFLSWISSEHPNQGD